MATLDSIIGQRVTAVLGVLLIGRTALEPITAEQTWTVAASFARDLPHCWQRMRATQGLFLAARTYLRLSRPGAGWYLAAIEHPLGRGRIDLWWHSVGARSLMRGDELKLDLAEGPLDRRTYRQLLGYLTAATATYGDAFIGIRLVSLAQSARASGLLTSPTDLDTGSPVAPQPAAQTRS